MVDASPATRDGGEMYRALGEIDDEASELMDYQRAFSITQSPLLSTLRTRRFSLSNAQRPGGQSSENGQFASPRLYNGASAFEQASSSVAVASPSLYSSRAAAKRFPNNPMYGEDESESPNNVHIGHHPRQIAASADLQGKARSSGGNQSSPPRQTARPLNNARGLRIHDRKASWLQLPAAEGRVAYKWARRRRRLARRLQQALTQYTKKLARPRLLVITVATLLLLYLYIKASGEVEKPVGQPLDLVETLDPESKTPTPVLPSRLWWELPQSQDAQSNAGTWQVCLLSAVVDFAYTGRRKRPSFASPRHTGKQLRKLLSSYDGERLAIPSIRAVIDCTQANPLPSGIELVDAAGRLSQQSHPADTIEILVRALDRASVVEHLPSASARQIIAVESAINHVLRLAARHSGFLVVLGCPTAFLQPSETGAHPFPDAIETLLRVAGSEIYAGHALALAGYSILRQKDGSKLVARSALGTRSLSSQIRSISQTTALDYAHGPLFIHASWLIRARPSPPFANDTSLGAHLSELILQQRRIYGLPISEGLEMFFPDTMKVDEALLAQLPHPVSASPMSSSSPDDEASPARVAVFLSDQDVQHEQWDDLICSLHHEQRHGHEVKVFLPADSASASIGSMLGACPDVIYRRETVEKVERYAPDVCLASQRATGRSTQTCTEILLPSEEVHYADWLPTLPLESLQSMFHSDSVRYLIDWLNCVQIGIVHSWI